MPVEETIISEKKVEGEHSVRWMRHQDWLGEPLDAVAPATFTDLVDQIRKPSPTGWIQTYLFACYQNKSLFHVTTETIKNMLCMFD